jgi:thiamine biosynthesis protein ThiS
MITLTVNGQEQTLDAPATIAAYLQSHDLDGRYVAVARNGDVIPREDFAKVMLLAGDRVEIVRPVGGG